MAKRTRRTPEQMIKDLQAEIERVKARAARAKVKKDPALRHVTAAVRSIDKAAESTADGATRRALKDARATLVACLKLSGAVPETGRVASPRGAGAAVEAKAVLAYLAEHPGSSGEAISRALGTDTKALRPVIKKLIADKRVKSKGKARGTRYSAVKA